MLGLLPNALKATIAEVAAFDGADVKAYCQDGQGQLWIAKRNHGFLRHPKGWRLAPAYDMNPLQCDDGRTGSTG
jgi:ligand-binding sensor domain-containing protein